MMRLCLMIRMVVCILLTTGIMMLVPNGIDSAQAILPEEQMANPADEARARDLATELRCLVCQNQTVDDSDADFAITIRSIIRDQISEGKSDSDIFTYLRQRYGDYILFNPPFNSTTLILWLAPIILLFGGVILIVITRPASRQSSQKDNLS